MIRNSDDALVLLVLRERRDRAWANADCTPWNRSLMEGEIAMAAFLNAEIARRIPHIGEAV